MKYFLLCFLFCSPGLASEIILDRTNHFGIRKLDVLKFEKTNYFFGGKKLGSRLPAPILASWREVDKGPKPSARKPACAAGVFLYIKKDNGKTKSLKACSEGAEYGKLIRHLEILRTYAKGL